MRLRLPSPPIVKYRPKAVLSDQDHGPGMVLRPGVAQARRAEER